MGTWDIRTLLMETGTWNFQTLLIDMVTLNLTTLLIDMLTWDLMTLPITPQWGAADAEIKVPSDENSEIKGSPFKAYSTSVYCHACYDCSQRFLPC